MSRRGRRARRGRKTQGSEISRTLARCRKENRAAFVPYLCAGDPDLGTTRDLLGALAAGGADVIELGIPFSDPMADGPTIQRSAHRALESGTTVDGVLETVSAVRDEIETPIVLMTYCNPIFRRGLETFAKEAAEAGVDGMIFVDLPPEEASGVISALEAVDVDRIFLIAPTSPKERVRAVSKASSGFAYYVSRTGVTGEQSELSSDLLSELAAVKKKVRLPLAVGFGISTPEQVAAVAAEVDAVVVGSHLVRLVEEHGERDDLLERLESRVRELVEPLRGKARRRRGR